jgi:catalase
VGGGQDSSDYARDPRGFAVKFYTRQGNYDIVGNNTPVFFLNDPMKFPDFVHSQKKNPQTNLPDPAAAYEFWASHPQSMHQMTILMSDRGDFPSWTVHLQIMSEKEAENYSINPFDLTKVWPYKDFPLN